jgi:hypothetical protein
MYGLKPVPFRGSKCPSVRDHCFEVLFVKGMAFRPSIITAKECGFSRWSFLMDELNCFE